jgi:hypothetical protein
MKLTSLKGSLKASFRTLRPGTSTGIREGSSGVGLGGAVTEVGGNSRGPDNVVAGKGVNVRRKLAKKREGLTNSSSSTENGNLGRRESRASEHSSRWDSGG